MIAALYSVEGCPDCQDQPLVAVDQDAAVAEVYQLHVAHDFAPIVVRFLDGRPWFRVAVGFGDPEPVDGELPIRTVYVGPGWL